MTDASGQLITSRNPVRQGELITLWVTGMRNLNQDPTTGLLQQSPPSEVGFNVAQGGMDLPQGGGIGGPTIWAGESPQFVGLDQVDAYFPTCPATTKATVEKRYDAFLSYTSVETGTTVRIYLPFVVNPSDPDCQWLNSTATTLTSSQNPSAQGQAVTFTATVTPSAATGVVMFLDGTTMLGGGSLSAGMATLSTSSLSLGSHSITATYSGDSTYGSSSATRTQTVGKTNTTTALTSVPNPSTYGQGVAVTAAVSPPTATGTVTFFELTCSPAPCSAKPVAVGSGTLSGGRATFSTSSLSAGTNLLTATYGGDTADSGSTSSTLTQTVSQAPTMISVLSSPNPSGPGQSVTFTVTVSPSGATGSVSFWDNGPLSTYGLISCLGVSPGQGVPVANGQAKCSTPSPSTTLVGGPSGSTAAVTQTVTAH